MLTLGKKFVVSVVLVDAGSIFVGLIYIEILGVALLIDRKH